MTKKQTILPAIFLKLLTIIVFVLFTGCIKIAGQERIKEVEDLLLKMTLKEKIGQLNLLTPGEGIATGSVVSNDVEEKIKEGKVGGLFGVQGVEKIEKAQKIAIEESRLKIPLLIGADVIHGYKTTYPIPLGVSSTWDLDLIEKAAQMAAKEATADGINWNFSPMVDIARDPRWGRIAEGAGEDPYLGSKIAAAMVRGYQGKDLSKPNTMLACVKHFALYGAPEAGRDYNTVDMSKVKMYNEYLPPYKAAIEAGAASLMTSFNDINGIPATANKWLLTDLLRQEWGFKGLVVSDYTSVNEMVAHGIGNLQTVSAKAINAGLDMDMVGEGFLTTLEKSVTEGKVSEETITNAARNVLIAKYKLGLFEDPYRYIDKKRNKTDILSNENKALAKEIAMKSFVLLKNNKQILPLNKKSKIALIGPLANDKSNMLGTWSPTGDVTLANTILQGIRTNYPNVNISYAKGANITEDKNLVEKIDIFGKQVTIDKKTSKALLKEALELANNSDVVVAVVGESAEMSGEASSLTNITIPKNQKYLIRELVKTGKPVVLVLMSGRPLVITEEFALPVSILQVWHPGIEAGNSISSVLYGEYNPSGKLTNAWPVNVGQIPIYHSIKNTGRPEVKGYEKFKTNYLDVSNKPLLPFGYGLSYTTFEYISLKINKKEIKPNESIKVKVTIKNTGNYDGEEIVQLYLRDVKRSITSPLRELKGFKKVFLRKGETKTITITLSPNDLKFYNSDLKFVSESGLFEVFIGTNSTATLKESFTLLP